jgi:imidazolonepropionase-like amidohydrolase
MKKALLIAGVLFALATTEERFFPAPADAAHAAQGVAQPLAPLGPSRGALARGSFAVTNVTVIPMTGRETLSSATVLVRDGRIVAVGSASAVRVPSGVRVIEGTNKYLIPGLTDTHTHLLSDGAEVHDSAGPAELGVMLANGVTTARLMIGTPEQLVLRRAVAEGRITGPQLWVASPQFTGRGSENAVVVTTAEQARDAVRAVADAGYDQVKITLFITRPVYDAIAAEAKARGIRVVGHVDPPVGLGPALAANQQLEHLDSFFEEALSTDSPIRESVTQMGVFTSRNWTSLDHIDNRKLDSLAGAVARAGVFVGPTQNVFNTAFGIGETQAEIQARPDWQFWPPRLRQGYLNAHSRYWDPARAGERTEARRRRYVEVRNRLVKAIHDSGGKLIAGSDTPEWFHSYGWGLHRELQAMVKAGLTPHQALATATIHPAAMLGASGEWGTIENGKRADFVLLTANPLNDIANTGTIAGVSIGGRWLARADLDSMLAIAARLIGGAQRAPGQASSRIAWH